MPQNAILVKNNRETFTQ